MENEKNQYLLIARYEANLREIANLEGPAGCTDYDYGYRSGLLKAAKMARLSLNPSAPA